VTARRAATGAGSFWTAFGGGVFGANSVPHLVTAARRGRLLTPYGGQDSGPVANLAWGATNLAAAALLTARALRTGDARRAVLPLLLGAAAFGGWALLYEKVLSKRGA
jgi:hypothetical protein